MTPFLDWPAGDVVIRRVRVPACLAPELGGAGELVDCDIRLEAGVVAQIAPALPPEGVSVDAGKGIVFPGFHDLHTHLDKGHIWPRASNADGTHLAAQLAVKADREANWNAADIHARAEFSLRCATRTAP